MLLRYSIPQALYKEQRLYAGLMLHLYKTKSRYLGTAGANKLTRVEELAGLKLNNSTPGRIQNFRLILVLESFVYSQSKFHTQFQRVIIGFVFIKPTASWKKSTLIS